ncbi:MAG: photosystem II oxygen evolving complex protein PsbP [Oscillatoriales cyanobacterium RM1_1_9]|nr:photosystem II oxygen evolving complex protein PsbP [Oscillatoriales cyanobacterium SM2_3_0]NJO47221.1 photosystem II oxygen evolving complex protein PsbP [Oscillatoriales cyanobacterium RM2_1_1]NJO71896.1 photosystem II oxygen evolving complex protein PsbP [Oscillatoriales cyanobacterium RM1_1_9]
MLKPGLKQIFTLCLVLLSLSLSSCVAAGAGFKSYVNTASGYEFLYPNGWLEIKVSDGPDVVFHDMIDQAENVSVVISPVPQDKTLSDIGTPSEVGYKLSKNAIAPEGSGREAELINAEARELGEKTYYLLEYEVKLPNQIRHDLASVAISRGQLFTLNVSISDNLWQKSHQQLEQVAKSFSVY